MAFVNSQTLWKCALLRVIDQNVLFFCFYFIFYLSQTFWWNADGASSSTVQIDNLECTKYNSICQANVVLIRRLEPGRYYDFRVSVKDTRGGMTVQSCSITATNYTTPQDLIFPHKAGIIMVPEVNKTATNAYHFCTVHIQSLKPLCFHLRIRLGCQTWHSSWLCDCTKKSTHSERCDFGIARITIVCHSPENRFATHNRGYNHFVGAVRLWNEINVPFDIARKCKHPLVCLQILVFSTWNLHWTIFIGCVCGTRPGYTKHSRAESCSDRTGCTRCAAGIHNRSASNKTSSLPTTGR